MLTRERLGYAPGTMDPVYLCQDIDALDTALWSFSGDADDLLLQASEVEAEARRLRVPDLLTKSLIQRSKILLANKRYAEAITALTDADQALRKLRQHDLKVRILAGLAEAHAHLGDWEAVWDKCDEGIRLIELHRYHASGQYLQSTYLRSRIGLYTYGVRAAFERKDDDTMLRYAELSKCRSVFRVGQRPSAATEEEKETQRQFRQVCEEIETVRASGDERALEALRTKRRTLWDLLLIQREEGGAGKAVPKFDLAILRTVLTPEECVLYYYWVDRNTLLVVVIDHKSLRAELQSVTPKRYEELEEFSRGILEENARGKEGSLQYVNQARNFAALLLPPGVVDFLKKKQRLLISPHRVLHTVPFHTLPWDEKHRYLIQSFSITYTPNLTCLLMPYKASSEHRLLALGIENYNLPRDNPDPLKDAELEVTGLENLYVEKGYAAAAWCGPEANEVRLHALEQTGRLSTFTTLHIATHGRDIDSDTPMESYLLLYDSILDGLEIANWQLSAELVVLSACSSGQRPVHGRGRSELPGDDLFGLQAAFFAAGAKCVLGSLWPVHTEVARSMMTAFHRFLLAGRSPEVALQSAIIDYLGSAEPRMRHSFFWAPFFLFAVGRPYAPSNVCEDTTAPTA